jgi:DNA-binding response OmpR family regulator
LSRRWNPLQVALIACDAAANALYLAGRQQPDLIVLAANLPQLPVDVVASTIRQHTTAPILVAVGPGDLQTSGDRLGAALMLEATHLLHRPYSSGAGFAQLNTHLQAAEHRRDDGVLSLGPLQLNPARLEVTARHRRVTLTFREYQILHHLAANNDRIVAASELVNQAWGTDSSEVTPNTLSVHIVRLRKSLQDVAEIKAVRRVGYRLTVLPMNRPPHADAARGQRQP